MNYIRGGDHVPCRAAIGEVVEAGELPCHLERFVERGVDGPGQTDVLGHRRQCGQHRERVRATDHVEVVDTAPVFTQSQTFGEKDEVQLRPVAVPRRAGEMDERLELDLGLPAVDPTTPWCCSLPEMRCEVNLLAVLAFPDHTGSPQRLASSSCERSRSACRKVAVVTTSSSAPVTFCSASACRPLRRRHRRTAWRSGPRRPRAARRSMAGSRPGPGRARPHPALGSSAPSALRSGQATRGGGVVGDHDVGRDHQPTAAPASATA